MPLKGEYEPSKAQFVRDQVELYESSGGTQGTTLSVVTKKNAAPVLVQLTGTTQYFVKGKVTTTPSLAANQRVDIKAARQPDAI